MASPVHSAWRHDAHGEDGLTMGIAHQIRRDDEAFSNDRPRRAAGGSPQHRDDKHRQWVKSLPSLISGEDMDVDPHHVCMADPSAGKRGRGKGKKVDDKFLVPLSRRLHDELHEMGEKRFCQKYRIDLVKAALGLWAHTGDDDAAAVLIRHSIKSTRKEL